MSNSKRLISDIIAAVVSVLRKGNATPPTTSNTDSSAKWRSGEDESPGQYGVSATRDCTSEEIRALAPVYAPQLDGDPDPGEVIWTWVPFVENDGRGKDRPVLIISKLPDNAWAACYLSTKHHAGFIPIGAGPWDSKGRESFLAPTRVLHITAGGMRREASAVSQAVFNTAVKAVLQVQGVA